MMSRNSILPESANYVFSYALFNLRNLLYIIWIVARRWCLRDETDTKKQLPMYEPKKPYMGSFFVKVEEYEP